MPKTMLWTIKVNMNSRVWAGLEGYQLSWFSKNKSLSSLQVTGATEFCFGGNERKSHHLKPL